jgi:hypothetical protein
MLRTIAVVAALGLWVAPAAAKQPQMHLDPPTMSAKQDRCTPRERAICEGMAGQRAIDSNLSCQQCDATMPAEIVAPSPGDTPRPTKSLKSPGPGASCEPSSSNPDELCPAMPPIDTLPRP